MEAYEWACKKNGVELDPPGTVYTEDIIITMDDGKDYYVSADLKVRPVEADKKKPAKAAARPRARRAGDVIAAKPMGNAIVKSNTK